MLLSDLTIEKSEKAPQCDSYDCVIIGGGPAGMTAAIYTGRAKLKTLLLEEKAIGGEIVVADIVENYPGFPKGISGADLTSAMEEQARSFGTEICEIGAKSIELDGDNRIVNTTDERRITAKTIIIAAGTENVKLNVPGEKRFTGRGVSYCAQCDGAFFRDREIIVVGGGDTAIGDAIFLTRFARKVYVVHRRDKLRAEKILQERAFSIPTIEFIWDSIVTEIKGKKTVEAVTIKNLKTGETYDKKIDGVFIFIGTKPNTAFVKDIIALDENGYIITNEEMETNQPGIFAAGDIRSKTVRQVATAVGDGAIAGSSAQKYIERLEMVKK
ncbi:MAG: thioredoxin-disulfide reductase [bacterium]